MMVDDMDPAPKVVIVVPTIREDSINGFLRAWADEFRNCTLLVVEDNPTRTFDIRGENVTHYCHADIENELGGDAWIIPRKTDCVRSFGYLKAWQKRPDMMITLDDDCYPVDGTSGFIAAHWKRLNTVGVTSAWTSTLTGAAPRGMPYFNAHRSLPCVLNHGLWESVPDFDSPTQLLDSRYPRSVSWADQTIPVGSYFPMCGMNVAVRPAAIPAFYFLQMGPGHEYDRFGDIWAGVIFKRIADHLGCCVHSGSPSIKHVRASDVWANLRKEAPGLELNEVLWQAVDKIRLKGSTFRECYIEIGTGLDLHTPYWEQTRKAMRTWANLFND